MVTSTALPSPTRPKAAPSTATALPTATASPQPTVTPEPSPTTTTTPIGPCDRRLATDDLHTLVSHEFGLSRDYKPADLVPLSDYLPLHITQGYPTEIRQVIVEPLVQMIEDMVADGLAPIIMSGYRSYAAQVIAQDKWRNLYPDRAAIVSAPPGHSEHQLGTTIDFGSPELPAIVGQADIEFHTYFYKTSEGQWLAEYAHEYGFTLSYPREAFELTGLYYEPWHFRYIGQELATELKERGLSFIEYSLESELPPCIP